MQFVSVLVKQSVLSNYLLNLLKVHKDPEPCSGVPGLPIHRTVHKIVVWQAKIYTLMISRRSEEALNCRGENRLPSRPLCQRTTPLLISFACSKIGNAGFLDKVGGDFFQKTEAQINCILTSFALFCTEYHLSYYNNCGREIPWCVPPSSCLQHNRRVNLKQIL